MSLHIRNGRVVEATGLDDRVIDIYLQNGKIVGLGSAPNGFRADQVIDADGRLILPGLIDIQARLRDPGEPEKAVDPLRTHRSSERSSRTHRSCVLTITSHVNYDLAFTGLFGQFRYLEIIFAFVS